jgi:organic radical activating enzyme
MKTYNKAESILDVRGESTIVDLVINRIKKQCETENLSEIARLATDDILFDSNGKTNFFLRPHVVEEITKLADNEIIRYLEYRYKYDVFPKERIIDKYPPLVQIEPASICNYRCVFCYQTDKELTQKKNGHMGVMSLDLFKKIVDELEGKVEAITLASRGEPLVNKQLPEMLQYLKGKFLAVKINTNASLLNDNLCHAILKADIQTLVFSADAAEEPLYSKLRVQGDLETVLTNIQRFNVIKLMHYPSSKIITRVSGVKYNSDQNINSMEAFWGDLVDQVMFVDYNPWENVYNSKKTNIDESCSDLWRRMFIWWDGLVAPCDVDYLTKLSKETVLNNSVAEIWQGNMYTDLRKKHLEDRSCIEPCSRCTVV